MRKTAGIDARRRAIVVIRFIASVRAASVTVLARRRSSGLARPTDARLGAVTRIAIVAFRIARASAARGIKILFHIGEVVRQRTVNRGVGAGIARIATVEPAASEELAHDLARTVDHRRAAAAAVGCAKGVGAIDEFAAW